MAQSRNNAVQMPKAGMTILAANEYYPFNNISSGINDNVLVVGGSGTGKTRNIVRPNILQASGSYIVSDPKGNLYNIYRKYLLDRGYRVERLDFVDPSKSTVQYNFFEYIRNQTDILKIAHMLTGARPTELKDGFWDQSAEILIECLISYLTETYSRRETNLGSMLTMLQNGGRTESDGSEMNSTLDCILRTRQNADDSMSWRLYQSIAMNPVRTWNCIVTTASSKYAAYDTSEIRNLTKRDTVHLGRFGSEKTALFIIVSDTDRSMDTLANVFFSQAMQELTRVADARPDGRLPVPVRFVLDDFATNVHIDEFPRMISSIRSRGISTMLMIQAESQLESGYGADAGTIISNCDTYVYLGGNDVQTARAVGERCDRPMLEILNASVGTVWVFRRGQAAHKTKVFPLLQFEQKKMPSENEPERQHVQIPAKEQTGGKPAAYIKRRIAV